MMGISNHTGGSRRWIRDAMATLFVAITFHLATSLLAHPQEPSRIKDGVAQAESDGSKVDAFATPWIQMRVIAAEEAFQAAADEEFVYAISNKTVAKYSRVSGAKIAVSHGAAKHLNSGFFWNGQLYCAHSNYPLKPEQSQIKVLDPATMKLSTFKDFGDIAGSLTWVLRHDDHWWCNFAFYGEENINTTLVKFDDQWQPQGTFRYPRELIRELGKQWLRSNEIITPTIPVGEPTRQIDYIMFHPANRWRVVETKVLDEAIASDHRAIFAVLELWPANR